MGTFGAVVVGVVSGWLVGYFVARAAVKKLAAAPMLERQAQWNEKALKAIMDLRVLSERIAQALKQDNSGLWLSLKMDLNSALVHLQQIVNESVIYAERDVYRQLRVSATRCRAITDGLILSVHSSGPPEASDLYQVLLRELNRLLLALAKPLREKLKLDPILPEDIVKRPAPGPAALDNTATPPSETPN